MDIEKQKFDNEKPLFVTKGAVRNILTLLVVGGFVYMSIRGFNISDAYCMATGLVLDWYFKLTDKIDKL